MHAGTYLLKLQIDNMIVGGCGQACPDMPKETVKTLRSQKQKKCEVDFVHAASYLFKLWIDYVSLGVCDQACPVMHKEALKKL